MNNSQKLVELLNEVSVLVPTLFFVGKMADGRGALYMGSPKGERLDKETMSFGQCLLLIISK